MSKNRFRDLLPALGVLLAISLQACEWPWEDTQPPSAILLAGTVDAHEARLGFEVSGRLARIYVKEGDATRTGQLLAELDATDHELALRRAQAQARAAERAWAALKAGTRPQELRRAKAHLTQTEAELRFTRVAVNRIRQLISQNLASEEQLDEAQMKMDVAQARVDEAHQSLALLEEGPRAEDVEAAAAEYEARQATIEVAARQLAHTGLKSPVDGVVSIRLAEVGEILTPGQHVFRVAELARPWVRAYLNETDLVRVRLGQSAEVRVDGLPDEAFAGRLSFISPEAEFTPKTVQTRKLRVDLVYRIRVDVDNPQGRLKIGMPADVLLRPADP